MPRERLDRTDLDMLRTMRAELLANTAGSDVTLPQGTVRVSNVPLFQETDGRLRQAVRVRWEPVGSGSGVRVGVSRDGTTIAQADLAVAESAFLFVPEVDGPVSHQIEVFAGDSVVGSLDFEVAPQRKWTVHLVHHSHYDIGYTDPQVVVLASQLGYIDDALDLATVTDSWPEESRFRWSIEVNWPLRHWLRTRSSSSRRELVRRVEEGRIEVNALPFSMHTEAYSYDELARQLVFAQDLRNELGIGISTAMQTDVPGATIGLSTLLTDAGIDFLAVAHNYAGRSIPHLLDGQALSRPFRWQAPDGDSLMVWYTDTLNGNAYMEAMSIGFGTDLQEVELSLPEYLNALAQRNYPYGHQEEASVARSVKDLPDTRGGYPHDILHLRVQGAYADNAPSSILPATIIREWNERYAWPKLVSSTNQRFHVDAESRVGDSIPTYQGDWTDWWADGIGSSAIVLGRNRASQAGIRTGQTLSAVAGMLGDEPIASEPDEVRTAYEEMALFDEHTWGASNPWDRAWDKTSSGEYQWLRKAGFAYTAEERVDSLVRGGIERLGILAGTRHDADGEPVAVFNPNSWARTDLVRVFLPSHAQPDGGIGLIDEETGDEVPVVIEAQDHARYRPLGSWLVFLARDVPATGYRRYRMVAGSGQEARSGPAADRTMIATGKLAVDVDLERAVIASLRDATSGHEAVAADAPFGFNAYIHDRYATASGFNHLSSRLDRAGNWLLGSRGTGSLGIVTERISTPVYERLRYRQTAQGADWIETTITVPRGVARVHIANALSKPVTMEKESVYFAFPFAGQDPAISFELPGGVARPDSPHVPGSARHFRAIAHWATIQASDAPTVSWATAQAPLVQVGNIHLPYVPFPPSVRHEHPGTIYSWALNNIWDTNFPAQQGGEMRFEYTVAFGEAGSPDQLGRDTGAAASQPLMGLRPRRHQQGADLPATGSLLAVDDERIEITHISTEPDGTFVAWLESHAEEPVTVRLVSPLLGMTDATAASFLGEEREALDVTDGAVEVGIDPGAIRQVRFRV